MIKDNKIQVFVSSTFQDMKEYRESVRNALVEIGVESAELGAPTNEPITELVSKKIKETDLVVFVLGHRYGSVEPESQKSFTEIELELARALNKPILVYLASEDVPWPITQIDSDRSRIKHLREELLSQYLVRTFSSPSDLVAKVATDFIRFLTHRDKEKEGKKKTKRESPTRQVRIVRLLLSSPGDVVEERNRYERAVFRFNQHAVEEQGIFIKE